jgi:hypothetical protein
LFLVHKCGISFCPLDNGTAEKLHPCTNFSLWKEKRESRRGETLLVDW